MDPKNDGFPKGISYSRVSCSGSMLNFGKVIKHIFQLYTSWWLNQPIWKKIVKLDHLTRVRDENKKYLSCHHLVYTAVSFLNMFFHLATSDSGSHLYHPWTDLDRFKWHWRSGRQWHLPLSWRWVMGVPRKISMAGNYYRGPTGVKKKTNKNVGDIHSGNLT